MLTQYLLITLYAGKHIAVVQILHRHDKRVSNSADLASAICAAVKENNIKGCCSF